MKWETKTSVYCPKAHAFFRTNKRVSDGIDCPNCASLVTDWIVLRSGVKTPDHLGEWRPVEHVAIMRPIFEETGHLAEGRA